MQVQVQMTVDVIERQAGGAELLKLRVDFQAKLFTEAALEKITEAGGDGPIAELTTRIDEAGNLLRRQGGFAAKERQVQADAELWILPRQGDSLIATGFVDHQAGGGQDAFAMRADDGFIDGVRTAEIVRVDDQAAQDRRPVCF